MRRILFNTIILFFLFLVGFLPTSFVLADSYELKVSPTTIYAGQEVFISATAKYEVSGGCTPVVSLGQVIGYTATRPAGGCSLTNPYVEFGDGAREDLTCYGPILKRGCNGPGLSFWECSCLLDTSHIYQNAQTNPYEVRLIQLAVRAREEVKVLSRPTLTPTASANPLRSTSIAAIVHQIGNTIFIVGAAGTFLMLLIGGYYLMFSRGNPSLVTKGKRIILISFIGFVILVIARGIIYFVESIFRS